MKFQVALLALVIGVQAQAQQGYDTSLPAKRPNVVYQENPGAVVQVEPAPVVESQQGANPIVIMNSQKYQGYQGTNQAVQQQPTTYVEASALSDSRAENIRRQRQGMEMQTEQKIVEKLEEARMEDEKARAERLFGNGFGSGRQDPPVYQPAPQPVPVVVAPPVEEKIVIKEGPSKTDIHEEVRAALNDYKAEEPPAQTYFMGALVGMADYPDAKNVKGNMASGLSLGVVTADRIAVEGTFLYSDYDAEGYRINQFNMREYRQYSLDQYNFTVAAKYLLLPGKVRPYIGGVVGYTYRKAMDLGYFGYDNGGEGSSNAFDLGGTAGVDLQLTPSFAIGGDFRYMTNVSYRRDNVWSRFQGNQLGEKPIEELDYYTITLNGKFTF